MLRVAHTTRQYPNKATARLGGPYFDARRPLAWLGDREAGTTMALYLSRFTYTPQTWARLIANPEDRRKAAQSYIESVGGKLHGFWYAFGTHYGYNLWEAPDNVSIWPRSRWRSAEAARLARWKRRFS
jgi:hypothetical protein